MSIGMRKMQYCLVSSEEAGNSIEMELGIPPTAG
jgi:hypothetical protein